MKKIFITIISFVCLLCCAIVLTACGDKNNPPITGHTHSFAEWVSDGDTSHTHTCSCGKSETQDHIWGEGTTTTFPSCKDFGAKTYSCTACKDTKIEQIVKLTTHTFTREQAEEEYLKTLARCTSKAVYYKSCSVCYAKGTDTFEYGDFTEHQFTAWTDDGDENHKCICSCGASETEPHDFTNGNCVCGKAKPIVATVGLEFKLNINDKESYVVKGMGSATDSEIVVPSEYNGKPVTEIAGYAFQNNNSIISIKIPDSVLYIGNAAFKDCCSLKSITVGSGIKAVDPEAFMNCPIETASIPAITCADIKNPNLKTVVIASGTTISDEALKGCAELTNITIGETVISIGDKAFQNCSSLTSINIPYSVETIGRYVFDGCNSLSDITVDTTNPNYASQDGILYNKAKTEFIHVPKAIAGKVVIPDGITFILNEFKERSSLTEITLPNTVTSIGFGAFYNCTGLTHITIPNSVTEIPDELFVNCIKLSVIRFIGTKNQWNTIPKGMDWDINTGDYIIRCTDEDLHKMIAD